MITSKYLVLISLLGCMLFMGCSSESESQNQTDSNDVVVLGKLELSGGWARPTASGATGGAYLTIANGTASTDTLISASSYAAQKVEIHESYKTDEGTMGMRPAGMQTIAAGNTLNLKPGGLHLMMMEMKRDLAVGDSLTLSLQFARVGKKKITIPVKIQQ